MHYEDYSSIDWRWQWEWNGVWYYRRVIHHALRTLHTELEESIYWANEPSKLKSFRTYYSENQLWRGVSNRYKLLKETRLVGKIHHNFLVPRMIESVCKTFMPIQTLVLNRVSQLLMCLMHNIALNSSQPSNCWGKGSLFSTEEAS